MGTRSIIMITGTQRNGIETTRLYEHDGGPTANLPVIHAALKKAIKQVQAANKRFNDDSYKLNVGQVSSLIIGESASVYGSGAVLDVCENDTATYDGPITREMLGIQGDLEWIYVIDLDNSFVNVFNGIHENVLIENFCNPMDYAKNFYPEYQKAKEKAIHKSMLQLSKLGFKINQSKPKARK